MGIEGYFSAVGLGSGVGEVFGDFFGFGVFSGVGVVCNDAFSA
jgi:hypothetical protein